MATLIYSMLTSLDGCTEDERPLRLGRSRGRGGGKRFFPDGVRVELQLVEERRFGNGVVVLRYAPRGRSIELLDS